METFLKYAWWFYMASAILTSMIVVFRFNEIKERTIGHCKNRRPTDLGVNLAVTIIMFTCIIVPITNTMIAFVFWRAFFLSFREA